MKKKFWVTIQYSKKYLYKDKDSHLRFKTFHKTPVSYRLLKSLRYNAAYVDQANTQLKLNFQVLFHGNTERKFWIQIKIQRVQSKCRSFNLYEQQQNKRSFEPEIKKRNFKCEVDNLLVYPKSAVSFYIYLVRSTVFGQVFSEYQTIIYSPVMDRSTYIDQ